MPYIRSWRMSDLPALMRMAEITAWEIAPPEEKLPHLYPVIARSAQSNLFGVLQSPGGMAFVADEGGQPVGFVLIGIQPDDRSGIPHGYLADIYVDPAHRRKGLSGGLHAEAEAYIRQQGLTRATNWVHAHNAAGQGTGNHHGLQLHALMLQKDLQRGQ